MNGEANLIETTAPRAAPSAPFAVYTNTEKTVGQRLEDGGEPKDRDHAGRVLKALHALQSAIDAAAVAGLIVEPSFKSFPNRFQELGCDADSYVAKVEIYRKLA
jgi:hypothetical protein